MQPAIVREATAVKRRLVDEATVAVGMLEASLAGLWELDTQAAGEILKRDDRLDREEVAIEETVFKLMALQSPVARDFRLLAVLGPEELPDLAAIRAVLGTATYAHSLPLREVAALLSLCAAVVTPDAGPMHLAIASGAPTIALFRKQNFARWGPRSPQGEVVFDPTGREVTRVLQAVDRLARRE